jgi:hypothetical protein
MRTPKNLDAPCFAAAARAGSWITMLQWETVDENATYPFERYRAVSGKHEYRVFHDPTGAASQDLPWILVVREVPEGGVSTHVHHGAYRTVDWAKQAAEQWEGPPPQAG